MHILAAAAFLLVRTGGPPGFALFFFIFHILCCFHLTLHFCKLSPYALCMQSRPLSFSISVLFSNSFCASLFLSAASLLLASVRKHQEKGDGQQKRGYHNGCFALPLNHLIADNGANDKENDDAIIQKLFFRCFHSRFSTNSQKFWVPVRRFPMHMVVAMPLP